MPLPGALATLHLGLIPSSLEGHSHTTLCCTTSGYVNNVHFQAGCTFLLEQVWLDTGEGEA
jgi:hypothetical protein